MLMVTSLPNGDVLFFAVELIEVGPFIVFSYPSIGNDYKISAWVLNGTIL